MMTVLRDLWHYRWRFALAGLLAGCAAYAQTYSVQFAANVGQLQALKLVDAPRGVLVFGYAQPGDAGAPGFFTSSPSPCTLGVNGAGDAATQYPAADRTPTGKFVGCFNMVTPPNGLDIRWFGQSYPIVLSVTPSGSSSAASYCTLANPCNSIPQAVTAASKFNWGGQNATIGISSGSFAGAIISGVNDGTAGQGISGQYLVLAGGTGGGTTTITVANGQVFNFDVSNGAHVIFQNLTCSVASGNYCVFTQNPGSISNLQNLICTGASSSSTCAHVEAEALIELNATAALTAQGTFGAVFTVGEGHGYFEFDPGGTGTISCGSGLAASEFFFLGGEAYVQLGSGWTFNANCNTATGVPVFAYNNSAINNGSGQNIPGNSSFVLQDNSHYFPPPSPSLGTCANGTISNFSTNYSIRVTFSGANTNCAIVFGKPSNVPAWFANAPVCIPTAEHFPTLATNTNSVLTTGINVTSGGFVAGDALDVVCKPTGQG